MIDPKEKSVEDLTVALRLREERAKIRLRKSMEADVLLNTSLPRVAQETRQEFAEARELNKEMVIEITGDGSVAIRYQPSGNPALPATA